MELTIKEKEWYEIPRKAGLSSSFHYLFRSLQSTDNSYDNPFSQSS